jgi:two-component system, response regulator
MLTERIDILLVEDNEYEAKLALHSLKKHNLTDHLMHIKDGQTALDFIFAEGPYAHRDINNRPKVILLDINLPKVSGLEILHRIKTSERTRTIPVVILTSSKESSDVAAGYSLGANSYIVKPLDFDSFSRIMTELGLFWAVTNERAPYVPTAVPAGYSLNA